jgi:hypothetical protein
MQSTIDFGMHLPVSHLTLTQLMDRTAPKSPEDFSYQYVLASYETGAYKQVSVVKKKPEEKPALPGENPLCVVQ